MHRGSSGSLPHLEVEHQGQPSGRCWHHESRNTLGLLVGGLCLRLTFEANSRNWRMKANEADDMVRVSSLLRFSDRTLQSGSTTQS